MVQMFGWLRAEAARASRWKRSSVCGRRGDPVRKDLDRDDPFETRVLGPVHFAHAAGAEQRDDFVRTETRAG